MSSRAGGKSTESDQHSGTDYTGVEGRKLERDEAAKGSVSAELPAITR